MGRKIGIIVPSVPSDLFTEPLRADEFFILGRKLDFSDYKTFIIAMELIYLEDTCMALRAVFCRNFDNVAGFVNKFPRFAQLQKIKGLVSRDFLLPLIAGHSAFAADALYSNISTIAFNAYADGSLRH